MQSSKIVPSWKTGAWHCSAARLYCVRVNCPSGACSFANCLHFALVFPLWSLVSPAGDAFTFCSARARNFMRFYCFPSGLKRTLGTPWCQMSYFRSSRCTITLVFHCSTMLCRGGRLLHGSEHDSRQRRFMPCLAAG